MPFPPVCTMIGFPYPSTATVVSGGSYNDLYWPPANLVDGSGKTAWRSAGTTGAVRLDLGSSLPCNFCAVFGSNFDHDLVLSVQMADNTGMSPTVLSRGVGIKQPGLWLDLRTITGLPTTARYVQLAWVGNSRPATIGELCVGLADEFVGMLNPEPTERVQAMQRRSPLDYGKVAISAHGALARTMDLGLQLDTDQRAALDAISVAAGASPISQPGDGTRVVVVPSTHRNDAWYVEWPAFIEQEFTQSDLVVRADLPLVEEVFGVR